MPRRVIGCQRVPETRLGLLRLVDRMYDPGLETGRGSSTSLKLMFTFSRHWTRISYLWCHNWFLILLSCSPQITYDKVAISVQWRPQAAELFVIMLMLVVRLLIVDLTWTNSPADSKHCLRPEPLCTWMNIRRRSYGLLFPFLSHIEGTDTIDINYEEVTGDIAMCCFRLIENPRRTNWKRWWSDIVGDLEEVKLVSTYIKPNRTKKKPTCAMMILKWTLWEVAEPEFEDLFNLKFCKKLLKF